MSDGNFLGRRKGLLFVVSGPAGSGKGTVMKLLMQDPDSFALSVSATTRAPGKNEVDGREYFFVSRERFEEMIAKKYPQTIHIDNQSLVRVNSQTKEYDDYSLSGNPTTWSREITEIIGALDKHE